MNLTEGFLDQYGRRFFALRTGKPFAQPAWNLGPVGNLFEVGRHGSASATSAFAAMRFGIVGHH